MKKFSDIKVGQRFWYNKICIKISPTGCFSRKTNISISQNAEVDEEWWHHVDNPTPTELMQAIEDGAVIIGGELPKMDHLSFAPSKEWRTPTKEDIGKKLENGTVLVWIAEQHQFPYKTIDEDGSIKSHTTARIRI
jgi:hypothetical protein